MTSSKSSYPKGSTEDAKTLYNGAKENFETISRFEDALEELGESPTNGVVTIELPEFVEGLVARGHGDVDSLNESLRKNSSDFMINLLNAVQNHYNAGTGLNLTDVKNTNIEDIRASDVGNIVSFDCRVTDRTEVSLWVALAALKCDKCSALTHWEQSNAPGKVDKPSQGCAHCDEGGPRSLDIDFERSTVIDKQECLVQDLHELSKSQNPSDILVDLHYPHIQQVEPGDVVTMTGIVQLVEDDDKTSDLYVKVIGVEPKDMDYSAITITSSEREFFEEIAAMDNTMEVVSGSFARTAGGDLRMARLTAILQLVGGVDDPSRKTRPHIHAGFFGDPGTFKSSLAKEMVEVAPNGQYISADGSSKVGITAAVSHEERFNSSKYTVTGGALVRAHGGHCVIDELDKGGPKIIKSLQEPLSEQTVTVEKVIKATLPAGCSVTLVANPKGDRFSVAEPLTSQVEINEAIFNRLDIVIPFVDEPDEEADRDIAQRILGATPDDELHLTKTQLTKFISLVRKIDPEMTEETREYMVERYARIRATMNGGLISVGARHLDSARRISQAHARIRMSDTVDIEDAEFAFDLMEGWMSVISTNTQEDLDMGKLTGASKSKTNMRGIVLAAVAESDDGILRTDIVDLLENEGYDRSDASQMINALVGKGEVEYEKPSGIVSAV